MFAFEDGRESSLRIDLRFWFDTIEMLQRLPNEFRAKIRELRKHLRSCFRLTDIDGFLQENWTGIEFLNNPHCGDARLFLAVDYGPVNGRRAAIFGQQREVHVEAAALRCV